jgi:uncharacterized membrane protein
MAIRRRSFDACVSHTVRVTSAHSATGDHRPGNSHERSAMATARYEGSYAEEESGTGWVAFAGTMLILVGCFNLIDGIAAIANSDYLTNQLLFANLDAWGWFFLIWGALQICTGFAVYSGAGWAAIVGVVSAFANAIAQLSWARAFPVWSVAAIVLDVLVIYALVVYGGRRTDTA